MSAALRLEAIFAGQAAGISSIYTDVLDDALLAYEKAHKDWPASEDWKHLEPMIAFYEVIERRKIEWNDLFKTAVINTYKKLRRRKR